MRIMLILSFFIFTFHSVFSQINYPFDHTGDKNAVMAYWYNVPDDSVNLKMKGRSLDFHSSLQIYGKKPAKNFEIIAQVYQNDKNLVYSKNFIIEESNEEKPFQVDFKNGFFKLKTPVRYLEQNPSQIVITLKTSNEEITKEIDCEYHKLYGKITDFSGNPFRGFVSIRPDAFSFSTTVWSDSSGNYEVYLPERTYNNIAVDDEMYGIETLEAWAWHVIMNREQRLDFKVGTGEIYNLSVWTNNGGGNTYFISFRPMSLHFLGNMNKKYPIEIGNKNFNLIDISPELDPQDIIVKINHKKVKIISMQHYYETMENNAFSAYLLQVNRLKTPKNGKQTISVEYNNTITKGDKKLKNTSMAYYQINLNYPGLSEY